NPMKNGVPLNNTALKQSVKKCVLGKLDSNMLKTPSMTPFRSHTPLKPMGSLVKLSMQKSLPPNFVNRDPEANFRARSCFLGSYQLMMKPQITNAFEYTDFPNAYCLNTCCKPITETWSENLDGFDALFDQLRGDFRDMEDDFEGDDTLPAEAEIDLLAPIPKIEDIYAPECEYKLNLVVPLPSFDSVQLVF
ncbi:hypothetical protein KR018_001858, partial [Drosophila ironensis]